MSRQDNNVQNVLTILALNLIEKSTKYCHGSKWKFAVVFVYILIVLRLKTNYTATTILRKTI